MSPLISGLASVASLVFNAASGASAKAAPARRGGSDAEPPTSAVVTISPQAEALAGFAGKGILVSQGRVNGGLSASAGGAAAAGGGAVSTQDFQELLDRFGADDAQKRQITAGFDANSDGSISRDEFLKGIASTSIQKQGTDFSQSVLQLMDRAGRADGVVSQSEFAAFTTAFVQAERRMG
jgi:hypothetical protein